MGVSKGRRHVGAPHRAQHFSLHILFGDVISFNKYWIGLPRLAPKGQNKPLFSILEDFLNFIAKWNAFCKVSFLITNPFELSFLTAPGVSTATTAWARLATANFI